MEPQAELAQPETEEAASPVDMPKQAAEQEAFSWQASEYVHHQKGPLWYTILLVFAGGLLAATILFHEWFGVALVVCMFAAVVVYARRAPRTLNYSIDGTGLRIENKEYPFSSFSSFAVVPDVAWHSVDLEPTQRFMPRLTILLDNEHAQEVLDRLSAQLPRLDRKPDLIERAARFLRF